MTLTVTNAILDGHPTGLRAVDGIIDAVGPDVLPEPGDETLDAEGATLTRALVNGHTHAAMTLFRRWGDDLPLMEWLEQRIWPAEARLTGDDVYWGTRLACLEMIRSGTVRFWDMYWHQLDVARAVLDSGIRATVGQPILEFEGAPDGDRLGLLNERSVLAHGVWLDDEELELVAERGATIVTNPVSNMKLAVGRAFPYPRASAAGVPVGLGTDGAASNNSLDLLADMEVLALLQKHAAGDAATMPAGKAWEIATGAHAPMLCA